jgi:hypothetical protein
VNATPVAEVSPRFPKTMAWTLTAVPQSSGMWWSLRYVRARSLSQERNTAPMAPQSCSRGSSGKSWPVRWRTICSPRRTISARSSAVRSPSAFRPRALLTSVIAFSNSWRGTRSTTSPYISRNRRRQSSAKRSPDIAERPGTVRVVRPRFRIVSIIPGIELRAPERTETRSGLRGSPKRLSASCSSLWRADSTSARMPSRLAPREMSAHTEVSIVNPGGTGTPSAVISARPAPLPPSVSLPRPAPSATPLPNENTRFMASPTPFPSRLSRLSLSRPRSPRSPRGG